MGLFIASAELFNHNISLKSTVKITQHFERGSISIFEGETSNFRKLTNSVDTCLIPFANKGKTLRFLKYDFKILEIYYFPSQ